MKRIALVTGGTRGIGKAISTALQNAGNTVIATYNNNEDAARAFAEEIGINTIKFDVCDYNACVHAIETVTTQFGPIDILVNNAGITRDSMLHKMPANAWDEVIQTNLTSCYNMTRSVIESMRERNFGRIINITSVNGQKGQVGQTNYSAAKAGVIGFTKALAQESASKGITVNAVAPGYIKTDMINTIPTAVMDKIISMIPAGRLGSPEEVATAVTFLASDFAGYITGITFSLNGGQYFV
ncbi:MAG: acetoacetyl-CoA reductase [Alphaproteobacteria bacterium]|nr:acetoacetyl-CoA reductase [Alphaproteobacteria bacterium]OJV46446.1 MAG: beta-ketoacyl-ACP reductase [Alphaproteobacteria bacterium 43-37]